VLLAGGVSMPGWNATPNEVHEFRDIVDLAVGLIRPGQADHGSQVAAR
jgi:hypothetical protein